MTIYEVCYASRYDPKKIYVEERTTSRVCAQSYLRLKQSTDRSDSGYYFMREAKTK